MALAGIRKLKRRMPSVEDLRASMRRLRREENDRVVAISICGFLDSFLKAGIVCALPNQTVALALFEDRGPLESFGAKIVMGHALGLYGKQTRRNLDILRQVRNLFAHDYISPLTFATPEIAHACRELVIPAVREGRPVTVPDLHSDLSPRDRYVFTALETGWGLAMNYVFGPGTHWEGEPEETKINPLP
jgi:hypothetical protein